MRSLLKISLPCLLTATLVAACASRHATDEPIDAAGTYTLMTVDGKAVPATISHEDATIRVMSGSFTINAGGTCSTKTELVGPRGGQLTREVNATYTQSRTEGVVKFTMRWEGFGTTVGTSDGTTFTMDNEGLLWVYRK
ncbi:MAG: hypothetical protein WCK33_11480 [Phycisphaerae bacterium]|jgi:hypothetical protein